MIPMLLRVLGPEFARPVRRTVLLMTLAAIAEGLSYALLFPALVAALGDDPGDSMPWLVGFTGAVASFAVLRYLADLRGFHAGTALLAGMYHRLGDHLAALPIRWHQPSRVGEVSTLASSGVLQAMGVIAHLLAPLTSAVVTPMTIVLVVLAYQWQLGIVLLAAIPLLAVIQHRSGRSLRSGDGERLTRDHAATARVVEYVQAQPVLRTGGRSTERHEALDDALRELRDSSRRSVLAAMPGVVGPKVMVNLVFTALLGAGALLAVRGDASPVEIMALLVLASRCADPLLALSDLAGQLGAARTVLAKLDAVLADDPLPTPTRPKHPRGHVLALDGVTVLHSGRTVLDDVSLVVPEGSHVAIVGPSGAGKSSLLQLIPRFHDPDTGVVRIGGTDVREVDPVELFEHITIVSQRVYLFDASIEENVRLARPDASDAHLRAAVLAARLDEVVERLPHGMATAIGEGGGRLSGGERQRVAIARALLKDAPIVLLDEVTAALDPINEQAVQDGIDRLAVGRTVITVAHRMRTVLRADHVVFLDRGRIVEQGSHDELLRRSGRYAAFWETTLGGDPGTQAAEPALTPSRALGS